jgi:pimeloyl-ACP methyl ester carboxylesterase
MKFHEYGEKNAHVIVMLPGSFCPASALEYLCKDLEEMFHVIITEYNGHYEGGGSFTTRRNEAGQIREYLKKKGIDSVCMVYGQSMGSEVGMELASQLIKSGVKVGCCFFDGAPMITLSKPYKLFMYYKFRTMIRMMNDKSIDDVIQWKFLNKFTNGDTESVRPMIESLIKIAPVISDESIRNETECCYTFDFPNMTEEMQRNIYFLYGKDEKACKTCYSLVKRAYPRARFKVLDGYGHLTYSLKCQSEYIKMLKKICKAHTTDK